MNGFVLAVTSEFIPRTVYQYQFSPDGTLKGYLNWSLSHFNVNDFNDMERPEDATLNVATVQQYCRFVESSMHIISFFKIFLYCSITILRFAEASTDLASWQAKVQETPP